MTNADEIRAMSDEELAKWLGSHSFSCPPANDCNPSDFTMGCDDDTCEECWLKWLRR